MAGQNDSVLTVLCFDVGARRTGIAVGNSLSGSARPLGVLEIFEAAQDGQSQPAQEKAFAFARQLAKRYGKPISLIDERNTSIEAAQRFAQSRARGEAKRHHAEQLDAWAAVIILERWFLQPHNRTEWNEHP